jgi:hypothetical protein
VVLSGLYGAAYVAEDAAEDAAADADPKSQVTPPLPALDVTSVRRAAAQPMTFEATADSQRITMVPVSRAQHEHFTVYWQTVA